MKRRHLHRWIFYSVVFIQQLCSCTPLAAQELDSLRNVLIKHVKDDTTKVNLYAMVASEYRNTSTDSMLAVAKRGIALANKLHFKKGKARCLASLGVAHMFRNDLDIADSICNVGIALLQETKDSIGMKQLLYYMGNIRYRQTKYKEAIAYFEQTIKIAEKTGDEKMTGKCLDNIGISYVVLGNNTEALKHFLKSLTIWEKTGNSEGRANALSNMARVYVSIGDNAKAIEYIKQSIALLKGHSDVQTIIHCYANAVSIYTAMKNYDEAIALCTESIRIADSTGQWSEMSVLLIDRGMSYYDAGMYDKAFDDFMKCLAPPTDRTAPATIAQAHIGLGEVWMARGNPRKSIPHLEIAYALFRDNEMNDQTGPAAEELGAAYEKVGDHAQALKYTRIGHAIKDSLFNEQNSKVQQQLQFDYELEKKQNQIRLLEKDKLIVQARNEMQRATLWGLIAGLALVVVIAIQLYRGRMKEKRSKETILWQANNLKELNTFKDKIFSVLSHDLRSPINSITTSVDLLDENLLSPQEFSELKPEMKKQLGAITFLLDNLLKWSKNYILGTTTARPESIDLHKIARQNITLLETQAREKNITVRNNIPETFTAVGDAGHIDIIVRNLLSNALKFTGTNGTITLTANVEGNNAKIHVADNGIGMTAEQIGQLFQPATHTSTYGTMGEAGTGLGLLLCYEFAKANKGDLTVESKVNEGSTFTITLPRS